MRGALALTTAAASFIASVSAASIHARHQNLHHARSQLVVDETEMVEEVTGALTAVANSLYVNEDSTSTAILVETSSPSSTVPPHLIYSAASTYFSVSSASVATSTASASNSDADSTSSSADEDKVEPRTPLAITYTPYTSSGSCKHPSQITSDIASIAAAGFSTIRLYATDCSGPLHVGAAASAHGLHLILGIYIDSSGLSGAVEQVSSLAAWGKTPSQSPSPSQWDLVQMVVVGNEAVFNAYVSAADLASFVSATRAALRAAGYTGPVTTTEPVETVVQNAEVLCPAVDVVAANIHPFFHSGVRALDAGAFVAEQLELLSLACGGEKEAWSLESGWPSAGEANGEAVPGREEQAVAVASIVAAVGDRTVVGSFEDERWRAEGDFGVERSWGVRGLFTEL